MRYLRLLLTQLRISAVLSMQYRWEFILDGGLTLLWTAIGIVPLYVAFSERPTIAGWTYEQAIIVVGWFTFLKGVLDGAINPSLIAVVTQIRQGTLDFTLLKPADAQFLVSTAKFEIWRVIDVLAAVGIIAWAFARMGRAPEPLDTALSIALVGAGALVLYSLWILVVSAAFWVVRLDNLTYLFNSLLDFARWPVSVFKGIFRVIFTFVVPLALMTTYPADAILGRLSLRTAALSLGGALAFALASRFVWTRAIGRYTSASS
jgi:ABC-2 type transport system permease protein